jgi:hypothetical protein
MYTLQELKARFGMDIVPAQYEYPEPTEENPTPEPVELAPETDPSVGWKFYTIPTEQITGGFAEYATGIVTDECYAFVEDDTLFVATKGTSAAAEVTE